MEWVKLGDLVKITKGKKVEESTNKSEKSFRYIQIEDLRNDDNIKYTEDAKATIVNKDHVLIAWDGANAGTVGFNLEGAIGSTISALEINELYKNEFSSEFLGYYLKNKNYYLRATSTGATIPHINRIALLKLKIPKINKVNQLAIVGTFKEIEKIINNRKEQIQAYDDLIVSLFIKMFGNPNYNRLKLELKKLGVLGKWKSGGTPRRSNREYYKGNIPWITSGELNEMFIDDSTEHINEIAIENSSTKIVPVGSLLLGMYDSAGLKSSITTRVVTTNQAIAFSKLNEDLVNTIYVYYCIQLMRNNLLTKQRGVRQKNFNLSMIRDIDIPVPSIELQNKFADYVIKIEEEKKKLNSSLKELENLFDAFMQEAFSGNLFKD